MPGDVVDVNHGDAVVALRDDFRPDWTCRKFVSAQAFVTAHVGDDVSPPRPYSRRE